MASVSLTLNANDLAALRRTLNPKQVGQALYQATTRSTRKGRVMAGDVVRQRMKLRKELVDAPKSRRAAISQIVKGKPNIEGHIVTRKIPLPLTEFRHTASKRNGVTVYIDSLKSPLKLAHAFKARVKSAQQKATLDFGPGHAGIFSRKRVSGALIAHYFQGKSFSAYKSATLERYNDKGYVWRLPIEQRFGPSIFDLIKSEDVLRPLTVKLSALYRDEVGNQISRFTDGKFKSLDDIPTG